MPTVQYAKDPFYNDAVDATILLTVKFVEFQDEVPFAAEPNDDTEYGIQLWESALRGDYGPIGSWESNPNYAPIVVESTPITPYVNKAYSKTLTAVNGIPPYVITATSSLPPGLRITNNTISGTATELGNTNITVQAVDSADNVGTGYLIITVTNEPTHGSTDSGSSELA